MQFLIGRQGCAAIEVVWKICHMETCFLRSIDPNEFEDAHFHETVVIAAAVVVAKRASAPARRCPW